MNLRRRLTRLECRPFHRPLPRRDTAEMDRQVQRLLCLPLPKETTRQESADLLQMMIQAQKDSSWPAVRARAIELHRKYGGEYRNADPDMPIG